MHRLFALEWDELVRLYRQSVRTFRFETFDAERARRGLSAGEELPYWRDGSEFWAVIESFVDEYLRAVAPAIDADPAARRELVEWSLALEKHLPADLPDTPKTTGLTSADTPPLTPI